MKQFRVMFGQRRFQVLVTIAVVLLAASVVIGSGATFTSTSANPDNLLTTGNLHHSSTPADGTAILTAALMKPGDSAHGSITLTNDGDIPGTFTLSKTITANVPGLFGGDLAGKLMLTISEGGSTVWSGTIGGDLTSVGLGTWDPGAAHTYDFTVTFPDSGTPTSNTTEDNAYKHASITAQFVWTAVQ